MTAQGTEATVLSQRPATAVGGVPGRPAIDRGSAWVVVALAFGALAVGVGIRTGFGLLLTVWHGGLDPRDQLLRWRADEIAIAPAIGFLVFGGVQPVVGRLADRYGPRLIFGAGVLLIGIGVALLAFVQDLLQLYLAFGIVISIGVAACSMVTATAAIVRWFEKRRGFAAGIVIAGGAAGQFLLVPLLGVLIAWWGWRNGLLALAGGVAIFGVLILSLLRDASPDADAVPLTTPLSTASRGILGHPFWFLLTAFGISGLVTTGFVETHLVLFAHDRGIDLSTAAAAMGVLGAFNILGTLVAGYAADALGRGWVLTLVYALRCAILLGLPLVDAPSLLFGFAAVFGFVNFAAVPPMSSLICDINGRHSGGRTFGWIAFSHQVGSSLGAYGGAVSYVRFGSYEPAIAVCVALTVLSVIFVLGATRQASRELRAHHPEAIAILPGSPGQAIVPNSHRSD